MRVKIKNKVYDSEASLEVGRQAVLAFGDPYGFEEIMYRKRAGEYFLLARGGELSQYPEECIIPLDLDATREWLERVAGTGHADYILSEPFADEKTSKKTEKKTKDSTKKTKAKSSTKPVDAEVEETATKKVAKTASKKSTKKTSKK